MPDSNDYTPPATGATVLRRQNELDALRFLIAQKRMYSLAKRWVSLRWFGMLVIGLFAPVAAVIWPQSSVVVGSIAGAWLFLGRTLLMQAQKKSTEQAAAVQEQFDFYVYEMPSGTPRPKLPSIEDVCIAAGPDSDLVATAKREEMLGWYVVADDDPGEVAVAIAQRSNAAYSYRLLRFTGVIWSVVAVLWAAALTTICVTAGLTLVTFLLGVILPLLPAFLDVTEYIVGIVRSARDREALYRDIETRIGNKDEPITGTNLRVWQESLFELRRDTPTVPDFIYRLQRRKNEAAMKAAAGQLSKRARQESE
ncbi:MAG: hypothetical protein LCH87_07335 [Actinobacteria bacterium]|nr:hypothetical protein [Actinomycetota bacterium]